MAETRISTAESSDLTNAVTDFSVDPQSVDGVQDQKETTWTNTKWTQNLGYYKTIPELRAIIDAKATWTIGKGFKANSDTEATLNLIKGWGKETFNTILENMIRTMHIAGDSFAEIIRNENYELTNLKVLPPESIRIVANQKGKIERYEQISKLKNPDKKFKPIQILHLCRNRVADEIHGVSMVESLAEIILMRNEAMKDMKQLMHRHVKPVMIFHLDTDNATEIAAFKVKMDEANEDGENMYVPKDVVVPEILSIAQNATLNPLPWIDSLKNHFYQSAGVPQIILGGSAEFTEATAKIAYLAFQQTIEEDQLYIEEQIWAQLELEIELDFPASLENELLSDSKKDGMESENPQGINPSETTAGEGQ